MRFPLGPASARADQPGSEDQPEHERQAGADDDEPADFAPFFAAEQVLRLGAGQKHQQQQAKPVDERSGCSPDAVHSR